MALIGAGAVIAGAFIAGREKNGTTLLVVGAVLLALGVLGRHIINLRGKWKNFEFIVEMARSDIEGADSLLELMKTYARDKQVEDGEKESPVDQSWRAVEKELEERIDRLRETLEAASSSAFAEPESLAGPTLRRRARSLSQPLDRKLVPFHEKAGDGKVRLHLISGDGVAFKDSTVTVTAPDGEMLGRLNQSERTMGATVIFPDDFPVADRALPEGLYHVRWSLRLPEEFGKSRPFTIARDGFSYP